MAGSENPCVLLELVRLAKTGIRKLLQLGISRDGSVHHVVERSGIVKP